MCLISTYLTCDFFLADFRKQVAATKEEAEKDGVTVPTTVEQYTVSTKANTSTSGADNHEANDGLNDFYDDDYMDELDDDDDEDNYLEDDSDSGNGES